jgi:hypothetical protein
MNDKTLLVAVNMLADGSVEFLYKIFDEDLSRFDQSVINFDDSTEQSQYLFCDFGWGLQWESGWIDGDSYTDWIKSQEWSHIVGIVVLHTQR